MDVEFQLWSTPTAITSGWQRCKVEVFHPPTLLGKNLDADVIDQMNDLLGQEVRVNASNTDAVRTRVYTSDDRCTIRVGVSNADFKFLNTPGVFDEMTKRVYRRCV